MWSNKRAELPTIDIDQNSDIPLHKQLTAGLRKLIMSGEMEAGERVPSTRELSKLLKLARNTVLQSYNQLHSEGYFESIQGSGTRVAHPIGQQPMVARDFSPECAFEIPLSVFGCNLKRLHRKPERNCAIDFSSGIPASEAPKCWSRIAKPIDGAGRADLAEQLVPYLMRTRGISCSQEQIIIFNTYEQALESIAKIHLNDGDQFIFENPGRQSVRQILALPGASAIYADVDSRGMQVASIVDPPTVVPLIYVTPSHQFPSGISMSLERRYELISWMEKRGAILVEDDSECEFRYGSRPVISIAGLNGCARTIYLNRLTSTVAEDVTLTYLVVPAALTELYSKVRATSSNNEQSGSEIALAKMLRSGAFDSHLDERRAELNKRRIKLIYALKKVFASKVRISGDGAGIHLIARFDDLIDDREFSQRLKARGIFVESCQSSYANGQRSGEFMLAFGRISEGQIEPSVLAMKDVYMAVMGLQAQSAVTGLQAESAVVDSQADAVSAYSCIVPSLSQAS